MNRYSTALSVIALAAVSAPYVCQAQDPAGKFKRITALQQNQQINDALKMCDEMLKYFQGKSSTVQQYGFYEPFFLWKKGELLMAANRYDEAYEAFKTLNTSDKFKAKAMRDKAKRKNLLNGEGFDPYLTASGYYMGRCLYQKGVGDPKKKISPDPSAFDKAIPALEEYLKLYQKGEVSKMEKGLKLDGQICFMLMQAYILKTTPDFKKAEDYLAEGRKSKSAIPDEMSMAGLSTVINVAMKNPEAISWVRDIIVSNPQSYSLGPVRMARHGSSFFGPAQNCEKMFKAALKEGNLKKANDSARSAIALMGMVPNMDESVSALSSMISQIGSGKEPVADMDGARYVGSQCAVVKGNYEKLLADNMPLDAFAVQLNSSIALDYGCHRMAKAGYKVLVDRYPSLCSKDKDGKLQPIKDKLNQGYAQLCRTTSDEATALAVENSLDISQLGDEGALALEINRMVQAQKDKRWEDVEKAAEKIVSSSVIKKSSPNYLQANVARVSALSALKKNEKAVQVIKQIFADNVVENATEATPEARNSADRVLRHFLCICNYILMRKDGSIDDKCLGEVLKAVADYETKYPKPEKDDEYLPYMYFLAIQSLMLRSSDEKKDFDTALELCGKFKDSFAGHDYYASVLLVEGDINLYQTKAKKDYSRYVRAITGLEKSYTVALERGNKAVAGEALHKLGVNGRVLMPKNGDGKQLESAEEYDDRYLGYYDTFWGKVYDKAESNRFALRMCRLELGAVKSNKKKFDSVVDRTQEVIMSEANHALAKNKLNPEVAMTVDELINAQKVVNSWQLADIEKFTTDFAAKLSPNDMPTKAALTYARLEAVREAIYDAGDSATDELTQKLETAIDDLSKNYKPADLTDEVCVYISNNILAAAAAAKSDADVDSRVKKAEPFIKEALNKNGKFKYDAKCDQADAKCMVKVASAERIWKENTAKVADKASIAVSKEEKTALTEAIALYDEVIAANFDPKLTLRSQFGKARALLVRNEPGDLEKVLAVTATYLEMDENSNVADRMYQVRAIAFEKLGKIDDAISIYDYLYLNRMGTISVSAPACSEMMRLMWKNPNQGAYSKVNGKVTHTAKWKAWSSGNNYVSVVLRNTIEKCQVTLTPEEKAALDVVSRLVDKYAVDPTVQEETRRMQADKSKYK